MTLSAVWPQDSPLDLLKGPCPLPCHEFWSGASRPQFKSQPHHLQPYDRGQVTSPLRASVQMGTVTTLSSQHGCEFWLEVRQRPGMQATPAEYTWAIITTESDPRAARGKPRPRAEEQTATGPRSPRIPGRGPEAQPRLDPAQPGSLGPPPPPAPVASGPKTAPRPGLHGGPDVHSALCPWCPYRRAAERRARRAGCGPGRLRRGEEQQVGVAGASGRRGRAGGGRRGAGVLRRGDDDDLRGVEQPQRAGPEQGLQRRRAWAACGGPGHGHGAHGPRGPGGRRRRRRGPMAAGRGEGSIPLRPRPPLPAKSRPLLRAKSFLPRKSHEPPSALTIGCRARDVGDGDGVHWLQRAGPAAVGGTGRRREEARPIAGPGARRLCRGGARSSRTPRPQPGLSLPRAWWRGSHPDAPRTPGPGMWSPLGQCPFCASHRIRTSRDPLDSATCSPNNLSLNHLETALPFFYGQACLQSPSCRSHPQLAPSIPFTFKSCTCPVPLTRSPSRSGLLENEEGHLAQYSLGLSCKPPFSWNLFNSRCTASA